MLFEIVLAAANIAITENPETVQDSTMTNYENAVSTIRHWGDLEFKPNYQKGLLETEIKFCKNLEKPYQGVSFNYTYCWEPGLNFLNSQKELSVSFESQDGRYMIRVTDEGMDGNLRCSRHERFLDRIISRALESEVCRQAMDKGIEVIEEGVIPKNTGYEEI